jgi:hypothetical protein
VVLIACTFRLGRELAIDAESMDNLVAGYQLNLDRVGPIARRTAIVSFFKRAELLSRPEVRSPALAVSAATICS